MTPRTTNGPELLTADAVIRALHPTSEFLITEEDMGRKQIAWAPPPKPAKPKGEKHIISVKPGQRVSVFLLGPKIHGCWMHWTGKTIPCLGATDCPLCGAGQPRRWKGYCACTDLACRQSFILELTEPPAAHIEARASAGLAIPAMKVTVWRQNSQRNSRIEIEIEARRVPDSKLPPAFDPVPTLLRLWGWHPTDVDKAPRPTDNSKH